MKYQYEDSIIEGSTSDEIIRALKDGGLGWQKNQTVEEFMRGFSDRYQKISNDSLPTNNSQVFVDALVAKGLLKPIA